MKRRGICPTCGKLVLSRLSLHRRSHTWELSRQLPDAVYTDHWIDEAEKQTFIRRQQPKKA